MRKDQRAELKRLALMYLLCVPIVIFAPKLGPKALTYVVYVIQGLIALGLVVIGGWVWSGFRQFRRNRQ
jgi:hypothetical protein